MLNVRTLGSLMVGAALAACWVGDTGDGGGGGGGGGSGGGGGGGGGDPIALTGSIAEDLTIDGAATLDAAATIESGVTVTFAAGSSLTAAASTTLTVKGTLAVEGTADAPVELNAAEGAASWTGIVVESGGGATLTYATGSKVSTLLQCKTGATACVLERVDFSDLGKALMAASPATMKESTITDMANGGVLIQAGADVTVVDSTLYNASGDIVVQQGGTLLVEYSEIGAATGGYDHCNFHIGAADATTIRYNDIPDGVYAFMIGGVTGAVITNNNFTGNTTDIQQVGAITGADFTQNYWSAGSPVLEIDTVAEFDVSNPAAALIDGAGPRI